MLAMRYSTDDAIAEVQDLQFGVPQTFNGDACLGKHAGIDFFVTYYRSIAAQSHGKPGRQDVSPLDFKRYLTNVVLSDVEGLNPIKLRVRLIGSHISATYGELRGKLIEEMDNPDAVKRISAMSLRCIQEQSPVLSITAGLGPGAAHLLAHACYFPLFNADGDVNMTLTVVFVERLTQTQQIAMHGAP